MGYMSWQGSLVPPLLISVQGFTFCGRPLSLLVAYAFPPGVFALPSNQQLEATKHMKATFTMKKAERIGFSIENRTRSDLPLTNIRLCKPLFYHYILVIKIVVPISSAESFMKTRIAYRMIMVPRKFFRTCTARSFKFFHIFS